MSFNHIFEKIINLEIWLMPFFSDLEEILSFFPPLVFFLQNFRWIWIYISQVTLIILCNEFNNTLIKVKNIVRV